MNNRFLNNLYNHAITKLKIDSEDYEKLEELNELIKSMKSPEEEPPRVKELSQLVYPAELIELEAAKSELKALSHREVKKPEKKKEATIRSDDSIETSSRAYADKYLKTKRDKRGRESSSRSRATQQRDEEFDIDTEDDLETDRRRMSKKTGSKKKDKYKSKRRM